MTHAKEVLIFIPTYNERDNVTLLYQEIRKAVPSAELLFCDDNSPDNTGLILDQLAQEDSAVHVLHRPSKLGLGTAHLKAFEFARQHNYRYLITMDADFTHHPSYLPSLVNYNLDTDIVIGSRYIAGGTMHGWGNIRLRFTYFWRGLIKRHLGMSYDCTGAFRRYKVASLQPDLYNRCTSKGFSFCIESLFHFHHAGFIIEEIPIQAQNRVRGASKLNYTIMKEAARTFLSLAFKKKRGKELAR